MMLRDINAKVERLGHLISDLLALTRGDEGKTVFEREPVTVVGDEARMIQVIMNLLDNAICYTHTGGGRVSLTVEARQGASARMTARVIPTLHAAPCFTYVKRRWKSVRGRVGTTLAVVLEASTSS